MFRYQNCKVNSVVGYWPNSSRYYTSFLSSCLWKLFQNWQSSRIKTRLNHAFCAWFFFVLHWKRPLSCISCKVLKPQSSPSATMWRKQKDDRLWTRGGVKKLNQYGKTPDTNYPTSRKGRFLPTDGNQLATWLPENTWAAVWSQDANEAEGKVEADLPTSWERRN